MPLTLKLVDEGVISLEQMSALTSANPAKITQDLMIRVELLKTLADIAIIDPIWSMIMMRV